MQELRRLDIDDLLLMQYLGEGRTLTSIASSMKISQPAISQRLRKIADILGMPLVKSEGRRLSLTDDGLAFANKASAALKLLDSLGSNQNKAVINIGTRPEVGFSWVSEAIFRLRKTFPDLTFHVHVASGAEILQRLGTGGLDAVLTSAPQTVRDYRSIEVSSERYVFAMRKGLSPEVETFDDLKQHVLIEYDRSFPFLRYMHAEPRAKASFKDVWFLGSPLLMARAIEKGHGVGIVPEYLLRDAIKKGRVEILPMSKYLDADTFRLIFRNDVQLERHLSVLAETLQAIGLS